MRPAVGLLLAAAAMAGCGAAGRDRAAPKPSGGIQVVNLQAMPTAVNWDDAPGPDGLRVRVYLFEVDRSEPVQAKGALEFLLYEGTVRAGDLGAARVVRTWRFDRGELPAYAARSLAGWGYVFALGWGREVPAAGTITLVARYVPAGGEAVASSPVAIAVKAA
jgi:hypothetical protein